MVSSMSPQNTDSSQTRARVTLDSGVGAQRLIAQLTLDAGHQSLIVQLAQIDVLAVLLLLGDLQLRVDLVGQLAEDAQTLAVAVDGGADAGVEPAGGLTLIGEGQVKALSQCFQSALDGEEVLFGAESTDAEVWRSWGCSLMGSSLAR